LTNGSTVASMIRYQIINCWSAIDFDFIIVATYSIKRIFCAVEDRIQRAMLPRDSENRRFGHSEIKAVSAECTVETFDLAAFIVAASTSCCTLMIDLA
jgi:hypothetical protein